jgi:hypothetical protein
MKRACLLAPVFGVGLACMGTAQARDLDHFLRGTFSVTGTQACLVSPAGFNANLTPKGVSFVTMSSTIGTRVFNGDGTGSDDSTNTTISAAPAAGASANTSTVKFTDDVAADRTVTVQTEGQVSGEILSGARAGQTFTVDNDPPLTGKLSDDGRSLTLATSSASVEVISFSNGDVQPRICARSRSLIKVENDTDHDAPGQP